jgi:replicative DNA helicase
MSILINEIPEYQQEWIDTVHEVKEYSDNSGSLGGLDFGFAQLNDAFNGLNPAVYQIAGPSNVGKSAFCLQLAWQVSQVNNKVYVIYFALDDRVHDILPRVIAMDQRIPISCVKYPNKYEAQATLLNRRVTGFKALEQCASRFKLRDLSKGDNIEYIESTIQEHKLALPDDVTLCIFIDNFFDIQVHDKRFSGNNEKYEFLAVELERISEQYACPIVCTAELRKLNGNRRPILDDIRDTIKIVYKAKAIMLCYNEVGIRGQSAVIFWVRDGSSYKEPLLEIKVAKNKLGEFKGRLFYQFWPEQSFLVEVPEAGANLYNQRISV